MSKCLCLSKLADSVSMNPRVLAFLARHGELPAPTVGDRYQPCGVIPTTTLVQWIEERRPRNEATEND
ncbi:hypothetical protein M2323_002601 [Rhodoblastus acidophilus]|nr:hypothetical protein [Rhodoblastus acidophilus]MCW2333667.1 hypothetical protein [Rhodoblastus acidophilus]